MNTKTKSKELRLRSDISDALKNEKRRIDSEIAELRRRRREIGVIVSRIKTIGRKAYKLMETKGERAEKLFNSNRAEGYRLVARILDLRGYCDLYRELDNRHIDTWVTLGTHPLD